MEEKKESCYVNYVGKGQLDAFISESYGIAKSHGFHDAPVSVNHALMLILTEISEAVDADRKGRCCKVSSDELHYILLRLDNVLYRDTAKEDFEVRVKDTVNDEFADVCIRIFDTCGEYGLRPKEFLNEDLIGDWERLFGDDDLCELMFCLSRILCDVGEESTKEELRSTLGSALSFVFCMCEVKGIHLVRHIELKMKYNELRPRLNGKKY